MCGRYTLFEPNKLQERFETENNLDLEASYNIAPGQIQPVIIPHEIKLMKWGLGYYKMINSRQWFLRMVKRSVAYQKRLVDIKKG